MLNSKVYYFFIFVPFILLFAIAKKGLISNNEFVGLLLAYVIYRQFTDVWRLTAKGVIKKLTWKTFINPLLQMKYFKELYLS